MDILKCAWKSDFIFFLNFLLFIKMGPKIQWSENNNFVKYLINIKKIKK